MKQCGEGGETTTQIGGLPESWRLRMPVTKYSRAVSGSPQFASCRAMLCVRWVSMLRLPLS